jgi:hypothetical protein
MESHFSEESLWASALAARLRLLQANFADDDAATRRDYLTQEIEHALKGNTPEKRKLLLENLATRFPAGPVLAPPPAAGSAAGSAVEESPEAILERLLGVVSELSAEQRAAFSERLKQAGLMAQGPAAGFAGTPEMLKRLSLGPEQAVDGQRAAKALAMLVDMVLTLDQLVWTLWKQVATKSMVRKEADLAKLAGEYLAGNGEVSTAQLLQALEKSRKLVAGLLGAVGRAGATYARERNRIFDPTAIEADARAEKKWNESVEYACWRKYVQLCKEYGTEPAIEKSIQEALVRAAENLIMGRPVG